MSMSMSMPAWWRELSLRLAEAITGPAVIADAQLLVAGAHSDQGLLGLLATGPGRDRAERLAVYQRQYWMRLLEVLQSELPTVAAQAGYDAFNRLSLRYLAHHPPDDPELHRLSRRFPRWLARQSDVVPGLVRAARWDVQRSELFMAPPLPAAAGIPTVPWRLWHGVHPLPGGAAAGIWVRWRTRDGAMPHRRISRAAGRFLGTLGRTADLDAACAALELTTPAAAERIACWYQQWSGWGWFSNPVAAVGSAGPGLP